MVEDSREGKNIAQLWLEVALCERDFDSHVVPWPRCQSLDVTMTLFHFAGLMRGRNSSDEGR